MQWSELYTKENEPSESQIRAFVSTALWDDLDSHLKSEYNVKPKASYSSCAMDKGMWKGWNVKYKKRGKSLCTLYPKQGYLLALVPIGAGEINEAELLMPLCTQYTQNLFSQAGAGHTFMTLAFEVGRKDVLQDMKRLIALRAAAR
jgi:AraC family transcriptional regulator